MKRVSPQESANYSYIIITTASPSQLKMNFCIVIKCNCDLSHDMNRTRHSPRGKNNLYFPFEALTLSLISQQQEELVPYCPYNNAVIIKQSGKRTVSVCKRHEMRATERHLYRAIKVGTEGTSSHNCKKTWIKKPVDSQEEEDLSRLAAPAPRL